MTGPIIGRVEAEMRISSNKVDDDVHDGLEEAGRVGDKDMKKLGKDLGNTFDKELKRSVKDTGTEIVHGLQDAIEKGWRIKTLQLNADGKVVRSWLERETGKAAESAGDVITSNLGEAITSGFKSLFGSAGGSKILLGPIIAVVSALIGFIVELVLAAVQAISSLVAVIALIPNLVFSVGLQVGVLMLAFHGLTTAIQGAFAAKNADELNEAIKNLTPSAQEFVRSLLPLKDVFGALASIAQEGFFSTFGDVLTRIRDALGPGLASAVDQISRGLGTLFSRVLDFFASPVFQRFLTDIVPSIVKWLDNMGPALFSFLFGITTFGDKLLPFFDKFGVVFTELLSNIGGWLNDLSHDPDFLNWLDRMLETFKLVGGVIADIGVLLVSFASAVDKAGGNEVLKELGDQLLAFAGFFQSDFGQKSLEGLIHAAIFLSEVFVGLLVVVFSIFGAFEIVAEFLKVLFTQWIPNWLESFGHWWVDQFQMVMDFLGSIPGHVMDFFNLVGGIILGATDGWLEAIGGFVTNVVIFFAHLGGAVITFILELVASVAVFIANLVSDIGDFFSGLGGRIANAIGNFGDTLYNAGRNLIQGLINGVKSMFPNIGGAISDAAQIVRDYWPFSPAKEGPLSGKGDPLLAGQNIIERIATGIDMEAPTLTGATANAASNVAVGTGAVQMNFYGPAPTTQQAAGIGAAAGNSLADTIAQRNTRLAVRSIGMAAATA